MAQTECYDGTRKPPMTTAANQVASGLMFVPVARAQPKLMSPGPAGHTSKWLSVSGDLAARRPKKKLTAYTFDPPPDTEQSSTCQEPSVDLALFSHARRPSAIEE